MNKIGTAANFEFINNNFETLADIKLELMSQSKVWFGKAMVNVSVLLGICQPPLFQICEMTLSLHSSNYGSWSYCSSSASNAKFLNLHLCFYNKNTFKQP